MENDLSTYPSHIVARIKQVPAGSNQPLRPENFGKILKEGGDALRDLIPELEPPPTKFLLDQGEAVDFIDQIRRVWPNAKVLMNFTPSAMCYYTMCGGSI